MISSPPKPAWHRLTLWILLLGLVVSLAINVGLFLTARKYYTREAWVRFHPFNTAAPLKSGHPGGIRVLLLGDSRIAEWPALPADKFLTINAGVPGETTTQILLRTETLLVSENPQVVLVQAGINDLKAIGVLPGEAAFIQQHCTGNIIEIVNLCRQHDAKVVLTLILPSGKVSWAREMVWSEEIMTALKRTNDELGSHFANAANVTVLDLSALLSGTASHTNDFSDYRDTLHLEPAAYQKLAPKVVAAITTLLDKDPKNAPPR